MAGIEAFQEQEITKVVGIESRGFILDGMLAHLPFELHRNLCR